MVGWARSLEPSVLGELEITDLNRLCLEQQPLAVEVPPVAPPSSRPGEPKWSRGGWGTSMTPSSTHSPPPLPTSGYSGYSGYLEQSCLTNETPVTRPRPESCYLPYL